jgi:hypothetical protein
MENRKLALVTVLIIVLEIYLHDGWGFCDLVLMRESDKFEYIAQPNQNRYRFGKHIRYNKYSMRSDDLHPSDDIRILGFGDSVLNGGMETDHDSLATTIIERILDSQYEGRSIRCLNISCANWSPDNCFAYMEEYGDFDADVIFLVVNSHDAYEVMDFRKTVDVHSDFPSKQSLSSIYEMGEYFISRIFASKQNVSDHKIKNSDSFNPGFRSFRDYSHAKSIPLLVYLHPDRDEIANNKYGDGGEEIIRFCRDSDIPIIDGLKHENISSFADAIRLNDRGQRRLANALMPEIKRLLETAK